MQLLDEFKTIWGSIPKDHRVKIRNWAAVAGTTIFCLSVFYSCINGGDENENTQQMPSQTTETELPVQKVAEQPTPEVQVIIPTKDTSNEIAVMTATPVPEPIIQNNEPSNSQSSFTVKTIDDLVDNTCIYYDQANRVFTAYTNCEVIQNNSILAQDYTGLKRLVATVPPEQCLDGRYRTFTGGFNESEIRGILPAYAIGSDEVFNATHGYASLVIENPIDYSGPLNGATICYPKN